MRLLILVLRTLADSGTATTYQVENRVCLFIRLYGFYKQRLTNTATACSVLDAVSGSRAPPY